MEIRLRDLEDYNAEAIVVGHILIGSNGKLFADGRKWIVSKGNKIISEAVDFINAFNVFKHLNRYDNVVVLKEWTKD